MLLSKPLEIVVQETRHKMVDQFQFSSYFNCISMPREEQFCSLKAILKIQTMVLKIQTMVLKIQTMVLNIQTMVLNIQTMVLDIQTMVLNSHTMVFTFQTMVLNIQTMVLKIKIIGVRMFFVLFLAVVPTLINI